jgi:hypothetical protein
MSKELKTLGRIAAIGACLAWISAGSLEANPINPFNTRPVTIGSSAEPTLQSVLDGMWGPGAVDAANDQQSAGMWGFSSVPGSSIPTMVVEYAGNAGSNVFGIWFGSDTNSILTYDLLLGPAVGGVSFDAASLVISGNTMIVNSAGFGIPGCSVQVNCTPIGGITNPLINPSSFGFYLRNGQNYFFSVDQLNPGGDAYGLAFNDPGSDTWALAFEDVQIPSSDRDFNDMVVKVESIQPVPEPGTLFLIGGGLTALWMRRRRRS